MMKFKLLNKITISAAVAGMFSAMLLSFGGVAQAACYQYNPNGFNTSSTPVFNNICGAPEGVGNESDFVRIRPDLDGNDEDNSTNNPAYTVGGINAACNTGDKFDVWNYLHNDASQDDNGNGTGSAVAHNVQTHMTAPLGTTASSFTFGDSVTASNAAEVTDSASLNCGSTQVKLSIVPGSVHIYSIPYAAWENLPDSSLNSAVSLGSPSLGSGDMWGCWNYRMIIVYQVEVTRPTPVPPQVTATCNMFTVLANADRTVTVNQFNYTAVNSSVKNVVINWGDNSTNTTLTDTNSVIGQTHQYAANGTYVVSALVDFAVPGQNDVTSGGPGTGCAEQVTFSTSTPPTVTPPTSTTVTTPPAATALVNTGPGSVVGLFAGSATVGTLGYRRLLSRRLTRQ
jgi:hypothetical protein